MTQLAMHLFGPPRMELDGNPVHITRRKAVALLGYLAVSGQDHSRDKLATLLWPENDQSSARIELSRTLSVLNRTLGKGWLAANRETAGLNKPNSQSTGMTLRLDVAFFREKLKICEANNHPETVACSGCLPVLEEAVELYSDEFMAGFSLKDCPAYDEWQFFQREELRALLANALLRLSSHYANALEYEAAIRYTRRWLSLDPLHEPAHRQMISLFSKSGQNAAALRQFEICRQLLADELGEQPSEETKDLYQQIQASRQATAAARRPSGNLQVQSTPFIGRETELAEIRAKLQEADCQLLTLLGPGGSGKTRLAIEVASQLLEDFKQGVTFVNLAHLQDADKMPTTVARALRFQFSSKGSPEKQLLDYLGSKEMLLILDNIEHLLVGAGLVQEILNTAPGVKILVTSRTSLAITAEHIYPVMGMAYPKKPEPLKTVSQGYSSVRLFESTARRRQPTFELTDDNLPDVIQICALLEGMPLGIVLAASWVRMLNPAEIAEEIAGDLAFLEADMQDLPQRQRGMRSVFNHSWRLLSDEERDVMRALSTFQGGFTRESAQRVAGASMFDLKGLTEHSMLYRTPSGRYEIHELLRQYAAERLARDAVFEASVRDKHSGYFCQALESWESDLQGPRQGIATQEMVDEIDNIRAAWWWAVDRAEVQITLSALYSLCWFYEQNYFHLEGQKSCQLLLDKLTSRQTPTRFTMGDTHKNHPAQIERLKVLIGALIWNGYFNFWLGNADLAQLLLQEGLALLKKPELPRQDRDFLKAGAFHTLSFIIRAGSRSESIRLRRESLELFRSLGLNFYLGYVLLVLTNDAATIAERTSLFEESIAVRRIQGDLHGIAESLTLFSKDVMGMCQFKRAEGMLNEALMLYKEISHQHGILESQRLLGVNFLLQGKFQQTRAVHQVILSIHSDLESTISWSIICATAGYSDIYMGDYDMAIRQAQDSLTHCSNIHPWPYLVGSAHAKSILGRAALAKKGYSEAQRWFRESIFLFQKLFKETSATEQNNFSQVLACLGLVERRLSQITQAKAHLLEALHVGMQYEHFLPLIYALTGIALLYADQGEVERAVELYALAATQGIVANSKWFDDIAGDEIARAAEKIPVEVVEAAKVRGRALDLWGTADELLVELEVLGWGNI